MCIRALDYCPPLDITFGDFLRAIITADSDLIADDNRDYRIAFIDAFRKRGIYPAGVKNLSPESLCYPTPDTKEIGEQVKILSTFLREFRNDITYITNREEIFNCNKRYIAGEFTEGKKKIFGLHRRLHVKFKNSIGFEKLTGLVFSDNYSQLGIRGSTAYGSNPPRPSFEVHSLHYASRVGPDGNQNNQVIVTIIQRASVKIQEDKKGNKKIIGDTGKDSFEMTGGCTLIFDLDTLELNYAISKPLLDVDILRDKEIHQLNLGRAIQLYTHQHPSPFTMTAYQAYFGMNGKGRVAEPFAFLHTH